MSIESIERDILIAIIKTKILDVEITMLDISDDLPKVHCTHAFSGTDELEKMHNFLHHELDYEWETHFIKSISAKKGKLSVMIFIW